MPRAPILGPWENAGGDLFEWCDEFIFVTCRHNDHDDRWRVCSGGSYLGSAQFPLGHCGADADGKFDNCHDAMLAAEEYLRKSYESRMRENATEGKRLKDRYQFLLGPRYGNASDRALGTEHKAECICPVEPRGARRGHLDHCPRCPR